MVNFIICEDDEETLTHVENIIDRFMMKNSLAYKVRKFNDYNESFVKIMKEPTYSKVYILDIQLPSKSGIDIARNIRNNDVNSVIIFLTQHEELGLTILKNELMFLSFINKYDNYENRLEISIKKALEVLKVRKSVRFEERGIIYNIPADEILYITRDSVERKLVIKTLHSEIRVNKTLIELKQLLGATFIQTHKSCIVNKDKVLFINKQSRIIRFSNDEEIDLLSLKYKKDLLNNISK